MLTRMFFFANQQILGLIASITRTYVGKFIAEWAPLWGNVGHDLGILDITAEYIARQAPDLHIDLDKFRIVYVDGKDWKSPRLEATTPSRRLPTRRKPRPRQLDAIRTLALEA